MKIAIIGSGAMGSLMGAKLCDNNDVLLFDHWTEHVNEINKNGLKIETEGITKNITNIKATTKYEDLVNYNVYIILVKGINTLKEIKELKKHISSNSLVVTLQNGLGNHYTINKYIDKENISYGMMDFSARLIYKGSITYEMAESKIALTMYNKENNLNNKLFNNFKDKLTEANFNVITETADEEIWKKLIINANFNAVSGITGLNIGTLVNENSFSNLVKSITKEIVNVASKLNINLNYEDEVANIITRSNSASNHYPSLAQDVSRNNKTEIDFINGAIVKEAKKVNVEVPVNETLYNLVKLIENNYDKGKKFNL